MLKELASAGLGSTIAFHQILGEGLDHSHSECYPPETYCICDTNLSAATTTTTANPADRLVRMSGRTE